VAVRFALLLAYFVILRHVLPKAARSLWFWCTWGCSCFYQVGPQGRADGAAAPSQHWRGGRRARGVGPGAQEGVGSRPAGPPALARPRATKHAFTPPLQPAPPARPIN
jgi:hypothetical protein